MGGVSKRKNYKRLIILEKNKTQTLYAFRQEKSQTQTKPSKTLSASRHKKRKPKQQNRKQSEDYKPSNQALWRGRSPL